MKDYCLFCGHKVRHDLWREHMLETHKAVLASPPQDGRGDWKPMEHNVLANKKPTKINN